MGILSRKARVHVWLHRWSAIIASLILVVITAYYAYLTQHMLHTAREQMSDARKTSQGQLILELNRDFTLNDRLYRIRKSIEYNKPILKQHGGQFTEQDIDDYIGLLELMSILKEREILDADLILDNFDVYIQNAFQNKEIRAYIAELRKTYGNTMYIGLEHLAKTSSKK